MNKMSENSNITDESKTVDQLTGNTEVVSKPVVPINHEVIREDMVETAVNFLMNPRVIDSPLTQKRTFLLKKGLSLEEIDAAIDRSTRLRQSQTLPSLPVRAIGLQTGSPVQPMPSVMIRSTQLISSLALFGGVIYGAYVLYKRFVEPLLFDRPQKPHPYVFIQQQLEQLTNAMTVMQTNMSLIETNIRKQIEDEIRIVRAPQDVTIHELKSELSSIKALLVNRRQFAATPMAGIPQWQLSDNKTCNNNINNKVDDESDQHINGMSSDDHNSDDNCNNVTNCLTNGSSMDHMVNEVHSNDSLHESND
ncbi:peroxisomal membrane protein PEX14-like [Oppia nitens]|uniref:peroxisomal membrane protein PEX14-like n=1 Tax=Oppia nitens TaxID=1686743 RepID=UPI0023DA8813|nr:peroxisomal membrane protein PEX14-like [Oppia nitens]